jgi:hypothetical protein
MVPLGHPCAFDVDPYLHTKEHGMPIDIYAPNSPTPWKVLEDEKDVAIVDSNGETVATCDAGDDFSHISTAQIPDALELDRRNAQLICDAVNAYLGAKDKPARKKKTAN